MNSKNVYIFCTLLVGCVTAQNPLADILGGAVDTTTNLLSSLVGTILPLPVKIIESSGAQSYIPQQQQQQQQEQYYQQRLPIRNGQGFNSFQQYAQPRISTPWNEDQQSQYYQPIRGEEQPQYYQPIRGEQQPQYHQPNMWEQQPKYYQPPRNDEQQPQYDQPRMPTSNGQGSQPTNTNTVQQTAKPEDQEPPKADKPSEGTETTTVKSP